MINSQLVRLYSVTRVVCYFCKTQVRIQRGGTGGPDPPWKSQVTWVSIGNKQLEPPWKRLDPPPPLENVGPPLEP